MRAEYDNEIIYAHIDPDRSVWLNLDLSAEHPGGPFFMAEEHIPIYVRDVDPRVPVDPPNELPLAIISNEPEEPNSGDVVTFDGSRSYDPYGGITGYKWNFGDGAIAVGRSAEHTYSEDGVFVVNLTVTDNENATDFNFTLIEVNKPPTATFSFSPPEPTAGVEIAFDASESRDVDGKITNYEWDFGDGYTAKGPSESEAYHISGFPHQRSSA